MRRKTVTGCNGDNGGLTAAYKLLRPKNARPRFLRKPSKFFHPFYLAIYPTHDANRSRLFSQIQEICSDLEKLHVVPMSVMLLLSPSQYDNFTKKQCAAILDATFEYIHLSRRH